MDYTMSVEANIDTPSYLKVMHITFRNRFSPFLPVVKKYLLQIV